MEFEVLYYSILQVFEILVVDYIISILVISKYKKKISTSRKHYVFLSQKQKTSFFQKNIIHTHTHATDVKFHTHTHTYMNFITTYQILKKYHYLIQKKIVKVNFF